MSNPKVLVVDDEPLIAMMIQDWLSDLQCETIGPAGSAKVALALIDGAQLDGAILDVTLDGHDSFAVAEVLRQRAVPFAFATGHGSDRIAERFRDVPTLAKPYDFESMRKVVARLLDRGSARPASVP